jgi:hypothetical protein
VIILTLYVRIVIWMPCSDWRVRRALKERNPARLVGKRASLSDPIMRVRPQATNLHYDQLPRRLARSCSVGFVVGDDWQNGEKSVVG